MLLAVFSMRVYSRSTDTAVFLALSSLSLAALRAARALLISFPIESAALWALVCSASAASSSALALATLSLAAESLSLKVDAWLLTLLKFAWAEVNAAWTVLSSVVTWVYFSLITKSCC